MGAGWGRKREMTAGTCDLLILRLWNVAGPDYDLQGLRNNREHGGLIPYDLPADGELQAPRA